MSRLIYDGRMSYSINRASKNCYPHGKNKIEYLPQIIYRHTSFHPALQILHFFKNLKVCGNRASSKAIGNIFFPAAFAHFVSLCHILVILTIFQTFLLLLFLLLLSVISNLWCYYFVLGLHKLCPYNSVNLINVVCALTAPLISHCPISLPFLSFPLP